ncbi:hypothetical protein P3T23_007405 [Paraburkholderia sp. GAS448]
MRHAAARGAFPERRGRAFRATAQVSPGDLAADILHTRPKD